MSSRLRSSPIPVNGSSSSAPGGSSPSNSHHDGHRKFEDIFRNLIKWGSPNKHNHKDHGKESSSKPADPAGSSSSSNDYEDDQDVQGRSRSKSLDIYTSRMLRSRRLSGDVPSSRPKDISQTHQTYTIYESIIQEGEYYYLFCILGNRPWFC